MDTILHFFFQEKKRQIISRPRNTFYTFYIVRLALPQNNNDALYFIKTNKNKKLEFKPIQRANWTHWWTGSSLGCMPDTMFLHCRSISIDILCNRAKNWLKVKDIKCSSRSREL